MMMHLPAPPRHINQHGNETQPLNVFAVAKSDTSQHTVPPPSLNNYTMVDDAKSYGLDNISILAQSDSVGTVIKDCIIGQSEYNQCVNHPNHITNLCTTAQPVTINCNAGKTNATTITNFRTSPANIN